MAASRTWFQASSSPSLARASTSSACGPDSRAAPRLAHSSNPISRAYRFSCVTTRPHVSATSACGGAKDAP
jgi:hypothetical protein